MNRPHLISRDELLAMGALDCPPEWRKSLSRRKRAEPVQRDLLSGLDEVAPPEEHAPAEDCDEDGESDGA